MNWGKVATGLAEGLVVLFVVAMVAGQLLGQPVLLSYVTTGSMQPTLDPGDGFVAIPTQLAGPVEEGDVVTFRAESLHGGGLTTHRVVGETDRGYVTKGDANPFADQDGDEPPVKRSQIVAVGWRPGGSLLAVPHVGTLVTGSQGALEAVQTRLAMLVGSRALLGTQGLSYLLFALSAVGYVADLWLRGGERDRSRSRSRDDGVDARLVVAALALVVVASATAAMVAPAGTQKFGVVSAESDSPGPRVIEQGTEESFDYPVGNGGFVPAVSFFEPGGEAVAVEPDELRIPPRTAVNATVTLSAPPETGHYRLFLTEHRYLAVLPSSHIRVLYGVHPWLPIAVIDGLLGGSFYLLGVALLGRGRIRERRRDGPSALARRVRRIIYRA